MPSLEVYIFTKFNCDEYIYVRDFSYKLYVRSLVCLKKRNI